MNVINFRPKKKATFDETKKVLTFVAEDRSRQSKKPIQEELDAITEKLAKLEAPSVGGAAKANAGGVYSRLTDHTKYTGAHKERFDAEGKGNKLRSMFTIKASIEFRKR